MICFKAVPSGFEVRAQFRVVVDFAVESNHQLFVQGGHRLRSGSKIKNRQTSVPEKDPGILIDPNAFPIRTTMGEHIHHPMHISAFSCSDKSGDTAHSLKRSAFGVRRSAFGVLSLAFGSEWRFGV